MKYKSRKNLVGTICSFELIWTIKGLQVPSKVQNYLSC